jgi:hypothetical protein
MCQTTTGSNLVLNRTDPIRQRLPGLKHQTIRRSDRPLRFMRRRTLGLGVRIYFRLGARVTSETRALPPVPSERHRPHPARAAAGKVGERVHYVIDSPRLISWSSGNLRRK